MGGWRLSRSCWGNPLSSPLLLSGGLQGLYPGLWVLTEGPSGPSTHIVIGPLTFQNGLRSAHQDFQGGSGHEHDLKFTGQVTVNTAPLREAVQGVGGSLGLMDLAVPAFRWPWLTLPSLCCSHPFSGPFEVAFEASS